MEAKELTKRIQKDLANIFNDSTEDQYSELRWRFNIGNGHSESFHFGMSDVEMLERLLREKKDYVSTMPDSNYVATKLVRGLSSAAPAIANWYTNSRERDTTIKLRFSKSIGRGFDKELKEKKSNVLEVVLSRGRRDECPYGFYIKTMYPMIDSQDKNICRETGRQYDMAKVLAMDVMSDFSTAQKTAMLYRNTIDENRDVQAKINRYGYEFLSVKQKVDDGLLTMSVHDTGYTFKLRTDTDTQNISPDYVRDHYPNQYIYAQAVRTSYEKCRDGLELQLPKKEMNNIADQIKIIDVDMEQEAVELDKKQSFEMEK